MVLWSCPFVLWSRVTLQQTLCVVEQHSFHHYSSVVCDLNITINGTAQVTLLYSSKSS